jgi:hypothetical protein
MKNKPFRVVMYFGFPLHGWAGLLMCLLFWGLNWGLEGLRTHWAFFPMWLGYILTMDGLCYRRKGHSPLSRNWLLFIVLFLLSIPLWWLFEWFNQYTGYWEYHPREAFSDLEFFFLSSLNFTVVIPGVFVTAEWIGSFRWINWFKGSFQVGGRRWVQVLFFIFGLLMLACVFLFPEYSPAFLWMSLYFLLDPLNKWLGYKSVLSETAHGDWRKVIALWTGSLICGFFWELWNYYAWPKWVYHLPFAEFWYVFEMPLLGYLGYLPFSLELYCLYQLLAGVLRSRKMQNYLDIISIKGYR